MGKRLRVDSKVVSTWNTGADGNARIGTLPDGWDGDGTLFVLWDNGEGEWVDRSDIKAQGR